MATLSIPSTNVSLQKNIDHQGQLYVRSRDILNEIRNYKELSDSAIPSATDRTRLLASRALMNAGAYVGAAFIYTPKFFFDHLVPTDWQESSLIKTPFYISSLAMGLLSLPIAGPMILTSLAISPENKIRQNIQQDLMFFEDSVDRALDELSQEKLIEIIKEVQTLRSSSRKEGLYSPCIGDAPYERYYQKMAEWMIARYLEKSSSGERFCPSFLSQCHALDEGTTIDRLTREFCDLSVSDRQELLHAIRQQKESDSLPVKQIKAFAAQVSKSMYFRRLSGLE